MRITCPQCKAVYEIDASLIPPGGRDVQCSACGHTWFQAAASPEEEEPPAPPIAPAEAGPDHPEEDISAALARIRAEIEVASAEVEINPAPASEAATGEPPRSRQGEPTTPADVPPADREAAPRAQDDTQGDTETAATIPDEAAGEMPSLGSAATEAAEPAAPDVDLSGILSGEPDERQAVPASSAEVPGQGRRPTVPPEVEALLREEAEREARARAAERARLERQEEMPLTPEPSAGDDRPRPRRPRPAPGKRDEPTTGSEARGAPQDRPQPSVATAAPSPEVTAATLASRLPSPPAASDSQPPARGPQPFRAGFRLALALSLVLATLYLVAPRLGEALPASRPWLARYVTAADGFRGWVLQRAREAQEKLRTFGEQG